MAHVLVFSESPESALMIRFLCEEEGHAVTLASTAEDALGVLRTTLHPLVGILDCGLQTQFSRSLLFSTIHRYPALYGHHRYLTLRWSAVPDDEQALLNDLGVSVVYSPFPTEEFVAALDQAIASLGG
jgi:CheY-like chemotaxis protein